MSAIYAREAISRVQLARLTRLSRPAVTELTYGLLERGLISEVGTQQAAGKVGKRPILLSFNPDACHLIAVDLGGTKAIGALLDLRGRIIQQTKVLVDRSKPIDVLNDLIGSLKAQATRPLLGIAIGTPGIVNSAAGIVEFAANLNWTDVPLAQLLSERFQLPVHIGNDTNLAVLGEHRFGLGQGIRDLVVVMIGTGIGCGIMASGHIVQGSTYGAGEIGHMPIADLNDLCTCGRRGCLETVVSGWAIARRAQQIAQSQPESILNRLDHNGEINALTAQQAAELGDKQVIALIQDVGMYLGLALTTVVHVLNPGRIILGGSLIRLGDDFIAQVRRTVNEHVLPQLADQLDIVLSELDDKMVVLGAGALLLERELDLWQSYS